MSSFEVRRIPEFETRQPVNKLFRNGKCAFDEFVALVRSNPNLAAELGDLFAIVRWVANGTMPPPPKQLYRKLNLSKKLKYTGYEAKSKHYRLYVFTERESGMILTFGGEKGNQEKRDLDRFEKIIKEYTQYR